MHARIAVAVLTSLLVILGFLCREGSSIDCYVCDSSSDPTNCGESINELGLQDSFSTQSNCAGCGKSFSSLGTIWSSVKRTCLTTESDTCDNKLGYGYCTCSTTFCNGQTRTGLPVWLIFGTVSLCLLTRILLK